MGGTNDLRLNELIDINLVCINFVAIVLIKNQKFLFMDLKSCVLILFKYQGDYEFRGGDACVDGMKKVSLIHFEALADFVRIFVSFH